MNKKELDISTFQDNELHLWHLDVRDYFHLDSDELLLTKLEIQRKQRFIFEKHQNLFSACRKLLKLILAAYLQCDPKKMVFDTMVHGKPYLCGLPLQFNVSHSHNYFYLGISKKHEVGVDIEHLKPRDFLGLARNSFSQTEIDCLDKASIDQREHLFYRIWCQKEAFIKLDGRGLRYPLKNFSVSAHDKGGLQECKADKLKQAYLRCYQSAPQLFAAFCMDLPTVTTYEFDNADFNQKIIKN